MISTKRKIRKRCPECGSYHCYGLGTYRTRKGKRRRWICQECGRSFSKEDNGQ